MARGKVAGYLINNTDKLGIDLDEPSELRFLMSYFNAKYMFPDREIKVFRSSSGDGYHIEIIGVRSVLSVRRTLGDCHDRMMYSELRSKNEDNQEEFAYGDPFVDDVLFAMKTLKVRNWKTGTERVYRRARVPLDEKSVICQGFWI
jgi:hypothetical protein